MTTLDVAAGAQDAPGRPSSIHFEDVSVHFRLPREQIWSFKEYAIRRVRRRIMFYDLHALDDLTMSVAAGETFGVIGRNGAGKSTFLKVIARVLRPTSGRVVVRGSVAPLLELGAGFHPDLTGRENVYLNATLLGHSRREIAEGFENIVDFSELGDFMEAPLRAYSSGMVARLGFALATAWRPDVLLVDELLAVGDESFQRKCRQRIEGFKSSGVTVVLVTHSLELLRSVCSRAMWLEHGSLRAIGDPDAVAAAYTADVPASGA